METAELTAKVPVKKIEPSSKKEITKSYVLHGHFENNDRLIEICIHGSKYSDGKTRAFSVSVKQLFNAVYSASVEPAR